MSSTPLRERLALKKSSPAHVKTLDILAKSSKYSSLSSSALEKYCQLAREESSCPSVHQAEEFLRERYGWEVMTRREDFMAAWKKLSEEEKEKSCSTSSAENVVEAKMDDLSGNSVEEDKEETAKRVRGKGQNKKTSAVNVISLDGEADKEDIKAKKVFPDRVYLSLKKDCFSKPTLLCQIEDHSRVKFTGDAGAVGRLTTSEGNDKITIDLKGQQYEGNIFPGPTVMLVNTAHNPFAHKSSSKSSNDLPVQDRMKVDVVTNEFCDLKFKKDLMSDLIGSYTGDIDSMRPTSSRKRNETDGDNDDEVGDNSDDEANSTRPKKKASRNPKISTINRKQSKDKKKRKTSKK